MPQPMRGGDIDAMRTMATMFSKNARILGEVIHDLDSKIVDSDRIWSGPAAEQFRGDWREAKASFQKMRQALDDAHTAVNKNAEAIQRATERH